MEKQVFVARERELSQLDGFIKRSLAAQGLVCFVTGEAGSGKTTLVTEFARCAQEQYADLAVAIGQSDAQTGAGDAHLPFREVMGQLTGDVEAKLAQGMITQENASRLRKLLVLSGQALLEVGPDLIGVFVPGAGLAARVGAFAADKVGWLDKLEKLADKSREGTTPGDSGIQQSQIFEQYANVLGKLSEKHPLLLVLDDLQWADTASIELLFRLGRRIGGHRILLVGTYRPEEVAVGRAGERHPLEKVLAELKRYFGDISVDLDRAEKVEGRHFVNAFLNTEPNQLSESFYEKLFQHTSGHPLFTIELLRNMQERGDLVRDKQDRWVETPDLAWESLPERVEGVIEERIGRLGQELRQILTVGSVEGEDFTAEVVARVQTSETRGLIQRLSGELERQHRLVWALGVRRLYSSGQRLSTYRFQHNLFQKYLYNELDKAERTYLHEDVGNALEELYGDKVDEIVVQLARHFEEAGVVDKAVHYLRRSGELAVARYANKEAVAYFSRALVLLDVQGAPGSDPAKVSAVSEKLADILHFITRYDEAILEFHRSLKNAPESDLVRRADLIRKIGNCWRDQNNLSEAVNAYVEALNILGSRTGMTQGQAIAGVKPVENEETWWQTWIQIYLEKISVHYWLAQVQEIEDACQVIMPVIEKYGTPMQRAGFLHSQNDADLRRYHYRVTPEMTGRCNTILEIYQNAGLTENIPAARFQYGFYLVLCNELNQAEKELIAALQLSEQHGDLNLQSRCLNYLTVLHRKRGQVSLVEEFAERTLLVAAAANMLNYTGAAWANQAWVAWKKGNFQRTEDLCQAAIDLWESDPAIRSMVMVLYWLAMWPMLVVHLAENQISQAITDCRCLLDPNQIYMPEELIGLLQQAVGAWEAHQADSTIYLLHRSLTLAEQMLYL